MCTANPERQLENGRATQLEKLATKARLAQWDVHDCSQFAMLHVTAAMLHVTAFCDFTCYSVAILQCYISHLCLA
jgi:hypothetical protein